MWLPELFKRMSVYGGSPCSSNIPVANISINTTCHIDESVYMSSFISAISNLPGNIITVIWIDKIGRNRITSLSLIASGTVLINLISRSKSN